MFALTYEISLQAPGAEDHHASVFLDEFAEPLRSLRASQRLAGYVKVVLRLLVFEVLYASFNRRTVSRGHRAQRHRFRDQAVASHAPRGRAVPLHVHQIANATPHVQIPRLKKVHSRQGQRVWQRLGALLRRSNHIRQNWFTLELVQVRQRRSTTDPRLQRLILLRYSLFLAVHALRGQGGLHREQAGLQREQQSPLC